jgi:hypothetical protein
MTMTPWLATDPVPVLGPVPRLERGQDLRKADGDWHAVSNPLAGTAAENALERPD